MRYSKFIIVAVAVLLTSLAVSAQTTGDIERIRIIEAENKSLKTQLEEERAQKEFWKKSRDEWHAIATGEKDRADSILQAENVRLSLQVKELRDQVKDDREIIADNRSRISSLKRQRNLALTFGTGAGIAFGYYLGSQNRTTTIVPATPPSFGLRVRF